MPNLIQGLHHITAMASDPVANNRFYTQVLGLRRVKKTVNFDAPEVYHLYYGNASGAPGTVVTSFPFPDIPRGRRGTGEVASTVFAVPSGALPFWKDRLQTADVPRVDVRRSFGRDRLRFCGPDDEALEIIEVEGDGREGWAAEDIASDVAIRGFHSAVLQVREGASTAGLLTLMGYREVEQDGDTRRFAIEGNGANVIDLRISPDTPPAEQGAGSVHHIAFAVDTVEGQAEIRHLLKEAGFRVTPAIDRDYFSAIYFRTPGGILFEIATNKPGFARDEDPQHLGEALKLPAQHEHRRAFLESHLVPF